MLNTTILNLVNLQEEGTTYFITRTLVLGVIAFLFFFFLFRTPDKKNYRDIAKAVKKKLEMIRHGNAVMLVKDGILQLDKLYMSNITPQQVYTVLRAHKINHLNDVERLFLIPGGEFTICKKQSVTNTLPPTQYLSKETLDAQVEA